MTAPKLLVPARSENRSDDPLSDGEAIPCVMEKTAAGAPAQESTQVCHPVSFCMSEITWALLGVPPVGVGLGLAPGLGAGAALFATGVDDEDAILPPHPAIAIEAARVKTTRLGRSRFFSFSIRGTLSECQDLDGGVLCSL
jgi:hypothetical protein